MVKRIFYIIIFILLFSVSTANASGWSSPWDASDYIVGISFDTDNIVRSAPGSDNWPVTWAQDGKQYTSWGDGGGFGGTNTDGRVSLGFGSIDGTSTSWVGTNIWGGKNPENFAQFTGKTHAILDIGGVLYAFRDGNDSNDDAYDYSHLYKSINNAASWTRISDVTWTGGGHPFLLLHFYNSQRATPTYRQKQTDTFIYTQLMKGQGQVLVVLLGTYKNQVVFL